MPQFRKKPVVIEAIRWEGATIGLTNGRGAFPPTYANAAAAGLRLEMPAWMPPARDVTEIKWPGKPDVGAVWRDGEALYIGTLEGAMRADPGDWIIRGVKGELYPCKPDVFATSYDPVEAA